MSTDNVFAWSATPGSNLDVAGNGIQGSSNLSLGNDVFQNVMAQIASGTILRGTDIATASTLDFTAVGVTTKSLIHDLTGTVTVTAVTLTASQWRLCRAQGVFQITASATLIVNGSTSVNYTTTAGDLIVIFGYGSSTVRLWAFTGGAVTAATTSASGIVQLIAAPLNSNSATLVPTASGIGPSYGQCQLTKVSTNLSLARYGGTKLFINGVFEVVPTTPVTLAPGAAVSGTLYYIYAFMSAGTMTLEFSTTVPATDATYGHQIKTADATRTLVGMARPTAGPLWTDSATQRFVVSYFNRRNLGLDSGLTTSPTTSSASLVEIASALRCEFLTWADEAVTVRCEAMHSNSGTRDVHSLAIGFDGTTPENDAYVTVTSAPNAGDIWCASIGTAKSGLAIGYHYATLLVATNAATLTITGAAAASPRTNLSVSIRG